MKQKILTSCLCAGAILIGSASCAFAEVWTGSVVASRETTVTSACAGVVDEVQTEVGARVAAGEALASLAAVPVYAAEDGKVALLNVQAGDAVDGSVLEISPESRYTIYCTSSEAYASAASTYVHSGETVYIKCTVDGTHRGTGIITEITGEEYTVEVTGGEFYIGETVYLYRDSEYSKKQRLGIGTLISSEVVSYDASGCILSVNTACGETVERGQLLFSYIAGSEAGAALVQSPVDGIVTGVEAGAGDSVEAGQTLIRVAAEDGLRAEFTLTEAETQSLHIGDGVYLIYASDASETAAKGIVESISRIESEDGGYCVRVLPESTAGLRIGQSVEIELRNPS